MKQQRDGHQQKATSTSPLQGQSECMPGDCRSWAFLLDPGPRATEERGGQGWKGLALPFLPLVFHLNLCLALLQAAEPEARGVQPLGHGVEGGSGRDLRSHRLQTDTLSAPGPKELCCQPLSPHFPTC